MSRNAKRPFSTGLGEVPSINSSQDPISSRFSPSYSPSNAGAKVFDPRRGKSLSAKSLNQDVTSKGNQGVGRDDISCHRGSRSRYRPVSAISRLEGNSRQRPIVITSDDDNDVGPRNHDNNENHDGIVLPKLEMTGQSGSPSSLHNVSRVNAGRRDSSRVSNRSRTPSRGRTRYRFSTLRGPAKQRPPCLFSRDITRERSATRELPAPFLPVPALQDPQRHTLPAEGRRRESQNSNHTSVERMTRGSESPVLGEPYVAGARDEGQQDGQQGYIPKGAFLVRKEPNSDQYRFPKASVKPQPSWAPGDGFSDAEAKPDFLFFVTGKRKRRISPSLPGMGKLTTGMDGTKSSNIRTHVKRARKHDAYQQKSELLRGERKDIWPTRHDFVESTLTRRDKKTMDDCAADGFVVPNTALSPPTYEPQSTLKSNHWKGKGLLDFRNFETEEATRSNVLSDLRRVRAWREEFSPCEEDDTDDDSDALMSDRGSLNSGPVDTGNEYEDDDLNSVNSKYSDKPFWDQSDDQALPGDLRQAEGGYPDEYCDEEAN